LLTQSTSSLAKDQYLDTDAFLASYQSSDANNRLFADKIVETLEDGLSWANAYLRSQRKEQAIYCIPEKLVLTGPQIIDMMQRRVREKPDTGFLPYSLTILDALIDAFPCPENSN
jgi:hypothetical protein